MTDSNSKTNFTRGKRKEKKKYIFQTFLQKGPLLATGHKCYWKWRERQECALIYEIKRPFSQNSKNKRTHYGLLSSEPYKRRLSREEFLVPHKKTRSQFTSLEVISAWTRPKSLQHPQCAITSIYMGCNRTFSSHRNSNGLGSEAVMCTAAMAPSWLAWGWVEESAPRDW